MGRYRASALGITTGEELEEEIEEVLRRCDGLWSLALEEEHDEEHPRAMELDWGILRLPTLCGSSPPPFPPLSFSSSLPSVKLTCPIPGLSSLSLFYPENLLDPPYSSLLPLPFQLSRLFLWLSATQKPPSPHLLDALFTASVNSLDELHIKTGTSGSAALLPLATIAPVAARLRSLVLTFHLPEKCDHTIPSLVAQCSQLQHLKVSIESDGVAAGPPLDTLLDIILALPTTAHLSHLLVDIPQQPLWLSSSPYRLISALSLPTLSCLRRLDFPAFTLEALEDEYAECEVSPELSLVAECNSRSISLYFRGELV